jgi:tetratricopeptide (TPR) repeat protein
MDAIISGISGNGIILDQQGFLYLDTNTAAPLAAISKRDFHLCFGDARDLSFIQDTDIETAKAKLDESICSEEALHLFLIGLDQTHSLNLREDAAEVLDAQLQDRCIFDSLVAILFSSPLAPNADIRGWISLCRKQGSRIVESIAQKLFQQQSVIKEALNAFHSIRIDIFGSIVDYTNFHRLLVHRGLFYRLVDTRSKTTDLSEFFSESLADPFVKSFPRSKLVLISWLSLFQKADLEFQPSLLENDMPLLEESEDWKEYQKNARKKRVVYTSRGDVFDAIEKIKAQKDIIKSLIQKGTLDTARAYATDLVDYQILHGGPAFASKSMSDLAMEAKRNSHFDLHLELSEISVDLNPADGRAWSQYGDSLLSFHRFDDAMKVFKTAEMSGEVRSGRIGLARISYLKGKFQTSLDLYNSIIADFPFDDVARCSHAEVLKGMGKLSESLKSYEFVIAKDPANRVARCGRAEVLKALGRFNEALSSYDIIIADYPNDFIPRTARAEILKEMGRPQEALEYYDEIISHFPDCLTAKNGRASVLRTLGRFNDALQYLDVLLLDSPKNLYVRSMRAEVLKALFRPKEALAWYDDVIADYPWDLIARCARAETLKDLNRIHEALAHYDSILVIFPFSVSAKCGRAETLKMLNRLDEALDLYNTIVDTYPENPRAKCGRAQLLKELNRLDDALRAYDEVIQKFPENRVARCGRAEVFKAMNRLGESLSVYNVIVADYPFDIISKCGRANVLRSLHQLEQSLSYYDSIIASHPENSIAQCGRAETLKSLGRLEEALATYKAVITNQPDDWLARCGCARVLAMLDKLDEGLKMVSVKNPVTRNDYFLSHVEGSILLLLNRLDEAVQVFSYGARTNPRPADRSFFINSLAIARIRQSQYSDALEELQKDSAPELVDISRILHVHAFGALGRKNLASSEYLKISRGISPLIDSVSQELSDRYLNGNARNRSDEWLMKQETLLILAS